MEMHVALKKRFRAKRKKDSVIEEAKNGSEFWMSNSFTDNLLDMKSEEEFKEIWEDSMATTLVII